MNRDPIRSEIAEIRNDMRSLNPNTSTYKKLEEKKKALEARLKQLQEPQKA